MLKAGLLLMPKQAETLYSELADASIEEDLTEMAKNTTAIHSKAEIISVNR